MSWLLLAIIGHVSNGVAFVIDKSLLSTAFKRSATYACLIGSLSLVVAVAIPWVGRWPSGDFILPSLAFGALFVFALWAFFEALKRGEPSRVVPIIGSLIPILTLIGSMALFNERLSVKQLIGFFLLLSATALLTIGKSKSRVDKTTFAICVIAAVLFAVSTLCGKYAFDHNDFLGVFVVSRITAGVTGVLIGLLIPTAGKEVLGMFRPKKTSKKAPKGSTALAVTGQVLGAIGFVCIHLAIKSGSASIVNALQAIQYALLVLAAFVMRKRAPKLLGEDLSGKTLLIKAIALAVTAIGLACVI